MTMLTTRVWDSSSHLKSDAYVLTYLNVAFDEAGDDAAFIAHTLTTVARAKNISSEALRTLLATEGNPELGTVLKVMRALGLQLHARKRA